MPCYFSEEFCFLFLSNIWTGYSSTPGSTSSYKNTGRHFTRGFIFGFHFLRASEIVIYFSFAGPEFTI